MKKLWYSSFIFLGILALLAGGGSVTQAQEKTLILATTTSTQDTGLLDVLIPIFEKKTG
ncbi:MAG: tungsten ABC transporter substrate-binding protein, partial [Deltaproteobacteria bacterium]|nr:tungsten ABC transporter substrate-binding protein [Deltaproteobacteria bacterium]